MKPDHEDLINEISKSSIELGPSERNAFIEAQCGDDEALKSAVNERVRQYEEAREYFGDLAVRLGLGGLADAKLSVFNGQEIGKYVIEQLIGEGGMGLVYRATDTRLNRPVALKFLSAKYADDEQANERFIREARAAAALNHPNVVTVYEIIEYNNLSVIVMEYVEGETLRQRLNKGPLEVTEVLDFTKQIVKGLSKAHKAGIIHRDLKPANIMVTKGGEIKILDFGLAKLREASLLTKEGTTMGTVAYMSPEQARGEETDERTDIWALGVITYEMLAGRRPFSGEFSDAVIYAILHEEPKPVTSHVSEVPTEVDSVVSRMLAKQPEERYTNLNEILIDLKLDKAESAAYILSTRRHPRLSSSNRILSFGSILLLLVVAGIFLFLSKGYSSNEPINSIAVLPLANMTGDAENDYLVDGVTDALIDRLGQIKSIERVISRTSVMQFKDRPMSLSDAGRVLDVEAIVEGSYRADGQQVQVDIRLIDAHSEKRLWSKSFVTPAENMLQLQNDMALEIVQQLEVHVMREEKELFTNAPEVDPTAYALYLKGQHMLIGVRGYDSNLRATQLFLDAIAIDSTFSLAYAGLAKSYIFQMWSQSIERAELARKANTAMGKAIALGGQTSEFFVTKGVILPALEEEWNEAEAALRQAIMLNHNDVDAYRELGLLLSRTGRNDEAIAQYEKGLAIDPLFSLMYGALAMAYYQEGEFDKATEQVNFLLEMFPDNPYAVAELRARLFIQQGRLNEAVNILTVTTEHYSTGHIDNGTLGHAYALLGETEKAETLLQHLIDQWNQGRSVAVSIASIYTGLRDFDNAFEWVNRSFEPRKYGYDHKWEFKTDPIFNPLRMDPRYEEVLNRVNDYLQIEE